MRKEEYMDSFINEIINAGKEMQNKELPELLEKDFFLFKETGNRLIYEGEYFGRRKFLTVYGIIAEFIDNQEYDFGKEFQKKEIFEKLSYILGEVCKEKFWALPAHVNFNALDECTIDLFAAETAGTLAEMLYLFGDKLDSSVISKVKAEILRRVLEPFCTSNAPYSWWETDRCNWSAVCAGSVGMAAIYMDRIGALPKEWKAPCLDRVCKALTCYMGGMEEDGACTEGLGYFSYGMSYFTGFAELYKEETGVDLMANEKVHRVATFQQKCYFGHGISISFSDGSDKEYFLPGLTAYLKANFHDVEIPDFKVARSFEEDACYRWLTNERNIRWMEKYDTGVAGSNQSERQYLLPSAQWMIVQDENGNGFAAKGGHNDENHNHNDIGSFLCVYEGEMLLTDFGSGEYTKDYFSSGRYTILCNRSLGHSVPLINGEEQLSGREYCADSFEWMEDSKTLAISFAHAYKDGLVDRITRSIHMLDAKELTDVSEMEIEIQDTFYCNDQTKEMTENLVTWYSPCICPDGVYLEGTKGTCLITGFSTEPQVVVKEHSLHDGKKTQVYLVQWSIPAESTVTEKLKMQFTKRNV